MSCQSSTKYLQVYKQIFHRIRNKDALKPTRKKLNFAYNKRTISPLRLPIRKIGKILKK